MRQPPLQLKHYFYPEFSVKASHDFDPSDGACELALDLNVEVDVKQIGEDEKSFELHLTINIGPRDDLVAPYSIKVISVGIFEVAPDFPEDQVDSLLRISAASILYSMAREFVLTLTARGPYLPMMLPTTSFMPSNAEIDENEDIE